MPLKNSYKKITATVDQDGGCFVIFLSVYAAAYIYFSWPYRRGYVVLFYSYPKPSVPRPANWG